MAQVTVQFVNSGSTGPFRWGSVFLPGGRSEQELTVVEQGLGLNTSEPPQVFLQARESDNNEHGYPDAFSPQVISATNNELRFRIRRPDESQGWGQQLQIDILMTEAEI